MSEKHKWSFAEEYNCCLHYIWCVFDYMGDDSLKTIVDMLAEEMPHIDRGENSKRSSSPASSATALIF